jgi:uncharacterized protein YjbI with pentapeptide repeats
VNLEQADLRSTLLGATNLQGGNVSHAKYNNSTVWPEGFTPPPEAVDLEAEGDQNDLLE